MVASGRVSLAGSHPAHGPEAGVARPVDPEERVRIAVVLRPAGLPQDHPVAVKARRQDAEWATRQPRLSTRELETLYAPAASAVHEVVGFARSHDLEVVEVSAARHDVILEGTVEALNRAFRVTQSHYEDGRRSYRSHDGPLRVPGSWSGTVEGVLGLDELPVHRADVGSPRVGQGARDPVEVAAHYRFPRPKDVGGQRIALLEFGGGLDPADLEPYLLERDRPPPPLRTVRLRDGGGHAADDGPLDADTARSIMRDWRAGATYADLFERHPDAMAPFVDTLEVTMDAEIVAAMAPGVPLDVVFTAPSVDGWRRAVYGILGFPYPGSLGAAGRSAVDPPTVISISWGKSERAWGPMKLGVLHGALDFARRAGVTVCCSSGDWGSRDSPRPSKGRSVHFPASSPAVLACGGTSLICEGGAIVDEVAWKESVKGVVMASGGGMSGFFSAPDFQASIEPPDPTGTWMSDDPIRGRWLPDVAACAGFAPGLAIRLAGEEFVGGGTSAATPIWASLAALLGAELGRSCGWLGPTLYRLAGTAALRSVGGADNDLSAGPGAAPRYAAGPGWDPCTGLGVPDGAALVEALRTVRLRG